MAYRQAYSNNELLARESMKTGAPPYTFTITVDLNGTPADPNNWNLRCKGNGATDFVAKQGDRIEWKLRPASGDPFTIVFKGHHWPFVGAQEPLKYPAAGPQEVAGGVGVGDYDYSINVKGVVLDPRIIGPGPGTP
jgi:hypothetical protein